jgi:hypothetical protein
MFTNISWSNYSIAMGLLVLVWYSFLVCRYYFQELKQLFEGKQQITLPTFGNKKIKQLSLAKSNKDTSKSSLSNSFPESFDGIEDAELLSDILINAIRESAERNLSNEAFRNYLKLILNDHPFIKNSSFRPMINEMMVSECEKHPQLILTLVEVDGLWAETI